MNQRTRALRRLLPVLDLLWIAVIFGRSLQSAPASSAESGAVLELIQRLAPRVSDHTVRKLAHFSEFFVLGSLLWATARLWRRPQWQALLPASAVAALDESIQRFVPGRSGEVRDALLDLLGAVCAVLLCSLVLRRRSKARRRTPDNPQAKES